MLSIRSAAWRLLWPALVVLSTIAAPIRVQALPERNLAMGVSFGMPQLAALQATAMLSRHVQLGFDFGLFGFASGLAPAFSAPTQSITLADNIQYKLTPTMTLSFNTLCPFVRYFPGERNFYFQFTLALYQIKAAITSSLGNDALGTLPNAGITGNITFTQTMPTLSIGHIFMSKLFYFNLSLGASFLANVFVSADLSGAIPDVLGGNAGNKAAIDQAKSNVVDALTSASDVYRSQVFLIPSLMLAVGFLP